MISQAMSQVRTRIGPNCSGSSDVIAMGLPWANCYRLVTIVMSMLLACTRDTNATASRPSSHVPLGIAWRLPSEGEMKGITFYGTPSPRPHMDGNTSAIDQAEHCLVCSCTILNCSKHLGEIKCEKMRLKVKSSVQPTSSALPDKPSLSVGALKLQGSTATTSSPTFLSCRNQYLKTRCKACH